MFDVESAAGRIRDIRNDARLSPHQKHLRTLPIMRAAKEAIPAIEVQARATRDEIASLTQTATHKQRLISAYEDLKDSWGYTGWETPPPEALRNVLQKNDCSRLHRLAEAIKAGTIIHTKEDPPPLMLMPPEVQSFIVSHDWAAVVEEVADADVMLPSEKCAFEFRISDRNVIVLALQEEGQTAGGCAFYETKAGDWLWLGDTVGTYWWKQVRAACIVLDAEVATHEIQRQPHALNAKRIKQGKLPMYDFHVIDLDRRRHRAAPAASVGTGSRKRLHFCRGHWRHYETSKTWIRWCLKGDPDLGFVDKEYRL